MNVLLMWSRRFGLCLTFLIALFTTGMMQAQAADTWLPDFDSGVHVYVDPALGNRLSLDANFISQVQHQAEHHNLQVYIVATQQGTELSAGDRSNWAPNLLHNRLWDRWRWTSGFQEDRILIILYIRAQNSEDGSIAVRSGSYLHGLNIDRELFSSSTGPVRPAAEKYMKTEPQTGLITIVGNIDRIIEQGGASEDSGYWFGWSGTIWLIILLVVLFIIILAAASGGGGNSGGSTWFDSSSSGSSGCGGGGAC